MSVATAVWTAIDEVRQVCGDPHAWISVLLPSAANATLLEQQLALTRDLLRVSCTTAARLLSDLGRDHLPEGLAEEPPGWLAATVTVLLRDLGAAGALGPYGATLRQAGWQPSLIQVIRTLENAGADGAMLRACAPAGANPARLEALAALLTGVEAARREASLASPAGWGAAAASAAAAQHPAHPVTRVQGAVVVGDGSLAPALFDAACVWLQARPCRRVVLYPLENVAPAPTGLRLAAAHAPTLGGAIAASGALARCQRDLYLARGDGPDALPPRGAEDDTMTLVCTPDQRRELAEVARRIQRAVRAGQPLDRIAVALADVELVEVLKADLGRAGIPATWQVGPPVAQQPAARFLLSLLALAEGRPTVRQWYALLGNSALKLDDKASLLGSGGSARRGQWRRIVARCHAHAGTAALLAALEHHAATLEAQGAAQEGARAAAVAMRSTVAAIAADLQALPRTASLAAHSQAWLRLLERWWSRRAEAARLTTHLEAWRMGPDAPALSLREAVALLTDFLTETPALEGRLSQPGVRVLAPMAALGGAFDLLCCPCLDHGRFPAPAREEVLLPESDLALLTSRFGLRLIGAAHHVDGERRRLASMLSACTGQAWLSWPATDLVEARPRIAGRHLLEVASALLGRRATHADVQALAVQQGTRADFLPIPEDALGRAERLAARAQALSRWACAASGGTPDHHVLTTLVAQVWTRQLLRLHLSIFQHCCLGHLPDAWTGRIAPELIARVCAAHPDDQRTTARAIQTLLAKPGEFFLRHILGAYPAPQLYDAPGVLHGHEARFVRLMEAALHARDADPSAAPLAEHFDGVMKQALGEALRWSAPEVQSLQSFAEKMQQASLRAVGHLLPDETMRPGALAEPVHEAGALPFTISGEQGWLHGATLSEVRQATGTNAQGDGFLLERLDLYLQAKALGDTGRPVDRVQVVAPDCPTPKALVLADYDAMAQAWLALCQARAAKGWYPTTPGACSLAGEHRWMWTRDLDATRDVVARLDAATGATPSPRHQEQP